jgi:cytochrome oxidase assembly protein ShyY1
MTHLTYIIPAYGLAVVMILAYAISAWSRMERARKRLAAIDPRAR